MIMVSRRNQSPKKSTSKYYSGKSSPNIGKMIRTFEVQDQEDLDEEDPWSGILAAVSFAVRATFHTTTKVTPMQLVCGRDAMLSITFTANWKYIADRKRKIIEYNKKEKTLKDSSTLMNQETWF